MMIIDNFDVVVVVVVVVVVGLVGLVGLVLIHCSLNQGLQAKVFAVADTGPRGATPPSKIEGSSHTEPKWPWMLDV